MFHVELGLSRVQRALKLLELQDAPIITTQILGTNGKGSTATFLATISASHGVKTGLYLSPHFVSPRERILIDGRQVAEESWLEGANKIFSAYGGEPELTYFEFLTILGMVLFREAGVEIAVLEAGLGGRNDATSAISCRTRGYSAIAMDHAGVIGPTLKDIARDKADVIHKGDEICSVRQYPVAQKMLEARAKETGASLCWADEVQSQGNDFALTGEFQNRNSALALLLWSRLFRRLGVKEEREKTRKGLETAFIPGRMQTIITPWGKMVLDGAHNPHGVSALARALALKNMEPGRIIYSCLGDKNWRPCVGILARAFPDAAWIIPQLYNERAIKAGEVVRYLNEIHPCRIEACGNGLLETIKSFKDSDSLTLMTGSLYLLGEFYEMFPRHLQNQG